MAFLAALDDAMLGLARRTGATTTYHCQASCDACLRHGPLGGILRATCGFGEHPTREVDLIAAAQLIVGDGSAEEPGVLGRLVAEGQGREPTAKALLIAWGRANEVGRIPYEERAWVLLWLICVGFVSVVRELPGAGGKSAFHVHFCASSFDRVQDLYATSRGGLHVEIYRKARTRPPSDRYCAPCATSAEPPALPVAVPYAASPEPQGDPESDPYAPVPEPQAWLQGDP